MDREHLIQRMRERTDVAMRRLSDSASGSLLDLQDVERAIYAECDRLKAQWLQAWADQAKDDSGRSPCPRCGGKMKQKEISPRTSVCVGGQVTVQRTRWWCDACKASFSPGGRSGDGGRDRGDAPGGEARGGRSGGAAV